jgi:hypothetical protein
MDGDFADQAPFRLVNSEQLPLTPELAAQIRDMPGSPTERELNARRLNNLRKKFLEGTVIPFHWDIAQMHGIEYRVNGQHSSNVLCQMNGNFPAKGIVYLTRYEVDDTNGLVLLFRQFDNRQSARMPLDISGAYQNVQNDLAEVPRRTAKLGVEGVNWYRGHVLGLETASGDDQYDLFNDEVYHPFLNWLPTVLPDKGPEVRKVPVIAAMYATFTSDQGDASVFWPDVIRGGREYEDQHPTTVLFDWFRRIKEDEFRVKQNQLYQGSIYAWNAFRDGKSTLRDIRSDIKRGMHKVL